MLGHLIYLLLIYYTTIKSSLLKPSILDFSLLLFPSFLKGMGNVICGIWDIEKCFKRVLSYRNNLHRNSRPTINLIWFGSSWGNIQPNRSEEHTSELQSRENLVCRLLLEKKKKTHST